ncbi:hypothetical protein Glove_441g34 [Diversispora epigaea]|uniref:Uncharacterized protein n=1 Tax=Diversispora epigaea TaxID=1348612 RepID=A0A397GRC1_9GLOM|nr:hypothetical protein Glove_441g34 [Diversispora epigaea]
MKNGPRKFSYTKNYKLQRLPLISIFTNIQILRFLIITLERYKSASFNTWPINKIKFFYKDLLMNFGTVVKVKGTDEIIGSYSPLVLSDRFIKNDNIQNSILS